MEHSLFTYIQSEIMPTAGIVEDNLHITEVELLITWIKSNLHVSVPEITPHVLSNYLLMDNETIIPKRRNFYLNTADFYDLELLLLGGSAQQNEYKEILNVLILPDLFCKPNEFYFCTSEEWMILTSA